MYRCLRGRRLAAAIVVAVTTCVGGCASLNSNPQATTASGSDGDSRCPGAPVDVVVSVDQWGDIVSQLGGECTQVKTVLVSSSVDPHEYEPSPYDAAEFAGARLIVLNGADYDPWAAKLAAISAPVAPVVSAAEVTKTAEGQNPHLWYSPSAVNAVADAVTMVLSKIDPAMQNYFSQQRASFAAALGPYFHLIEAIKAHAAGKSFAATEGIFHYMSDALGLVDKTPNGYQQAVASESDPAPADVHTFLDELARHAIDVLIYNPQTEGSIPDQIRSAAEQSGVPVVTVTETVPQDQSTFVGWQDAQLTALAKALHVPH